MTLTITTIILRVLLIAVLIGIMIMLLLSVNYMLSSPLKSQAADADKLRRDVDDNDEVIPKESVFRDFLARKENHTGKSNESHKHKRIPT